MQLEWNRFLEGLALFKQYQGLLWLCCIATFVVLYKQRKLKQNALWITALMLGIAVFFPVTAIVLLKAYTPYFNWLDLQGVFPISLLMGYLGATLFSYLKKQAVPGHRAKAGMQAVIAMACVVIVFLTATNFHGFDERGKADRNGVPVEVSEVFDALKEYVGEEAIVLAAPSNVLQYTRLYNYDWKQLYGRDLWDPKAASYIDSAYKEEYQYYEYLEKIEPELEVRDGFAPLVETGKADCIIVPHLWTYWMEEMDGFEVISLTDSYVGIIKKDLLK